LVGITALAPIIGMQLGIKIDPSTVGTLVNAIVSWVGTGAQIVGYALWLYGSFQPSATLTVLPKVAA